MRKSLSLIGIIVLGIIAGVSGYTLYYKQAGSEINAGASSTKQAPLPMLGQMRPDFSLSDIDGQSHNISEWDNNVIVLNFWATWCPPCRREIPALIEIQNQFGPKGVQVLGVAIDQLNLVEEYGDMMGINYPVLVGELEASNITQQYGNSFGQLPYTVIIDRNGKIAHIKRGEITTAQAATAITPLL